MNLRLKIAKLLAPIPAPNITEVKMLEAPEVIEPETLH